MFCAENHFLVINAPKHKPLVPLKDAIVQPSALVSSAKSMLVDIEYFKPEYDKIYRDYNHRKNVAQLAYVRNMAKLLGGNTSLPQLEFQISADTLLGCDREMLLALIWPF